MIINSVLLIYFFNIGFICWTTFYVQYCNRLLYFIKRLCCPIFHALHGNEKRKTEICCLIVPEMINNIKTLHIIGLLKPGKILIKRI